MKKILVLTGIIVAATIAVYFTSCKGKQAETISIPSPDDSASQVLARGKYLVEHVANCVDCHSKRDFTKFSGPVIPGTEGGGGLAFDQKFQIPGVVYGRNITPDNETGIGTWTDDDILKAITQGVSKRGDTLFPLMPYVNYNHMAKSDLMAIIAYIRTLKPIKNKVPQRQLMVPIAMIYPARALQPSVDSNRLPPASDKIHMGQYLAAMADCATCHSPMSPNGPDLTKAFSGGYVFDLGSNKVASANITPDSATGIGSWNEERFLNKFIPYREEKNYNYNPGAQNTVMPLTGYSGMTDDDLKAIYAFLRTIPPISHQVEKFPK